MKALLGTIVVGTSAAAALGWAPSRSHAPELFKSLTQTPAIVQVPYRGTGPAIADLIGGRVSVGILGVTGQVLEFHRSGKVRVLP